MRGAGAQRGADDAESAPEFEKPVACAERAQPGPELGDFVVAVAKCLPFACRGTLNAQSLFRHLPSDPGDITYLALPEIVAEKVRACYQFSKAREFHDLSVFATRPLDPPLIRRLVVLRYWQAGDTFDREAVMAKFDDASVYDRDDLRQLVRRTQPIKPARITAAYLKGFAFLAELDLAETQFAFDPHLHHQSLWRMLQDKIPLSR